MKATRSTIKLRAIVTYLQARCLLCAAGGPRSPRTCRRHPRLPSTFAGNRNHQERRLELVGQAARLRSHGATLSRRHHARSEGERRSLAGTACRGPSRVGVSPGTAQEERFSPLNRRRGTRARPVRGNHPYRERRVPTTFSSTTRGCYHRSHRHLHPERRIHRVLHQRLRRLKVVEGVRVEDRQATTTLHRSLMRGDQVLL